MDVFQFFYEKAYKFAVYIGIDGMIAERKNDGLAALRFRHLRIGSKKMMSVLRVQSKLFMIIREWLHSQGFVEIQPPIMSPATDPGIRGAERVRIDYYGREYFLTTSMILYKQLMISVFDKVFSFSPNVRMEKAEVVSTGRHLSEFWQVDLEVRNAECKDVMNIGEKLLVYVCSRIKRECKAELECLGRKLKKPKTPFKRITYREAVDIGNTIGFDLDYIKEIPWEAEEAISKTSDEPFWIVDFPYGSRGFYDKQNTENLNILNDFDLIYPDGYGEAVSGGEREYEYDKVLRKLKHFGNYEKEYKWYLELLKKGIPPSAGFGIGVERLTRYICGLEKIWDATPFPKVPEIYSP